MSRKAREGIEQGQYYPEPAWITARGKLRFTYRFLLGRPMDGMRWTDSTFWRSATRGEDHAWLRLAGWQRAVLRLLVSYGALVLTPLSVALWAWRGWMWGLLPLAAHLVLWSALAAPVVLYRLVRDHGLSVPVIESYVNEDAEKRRRWVRRVLVHGRREWLNEKIIPVARTVAAKTGRRFHPKEAAQWVSVPRDYRDNPASAVEVLLPGNFVLTEAARRTLARSVGERLGMRDPSFSYELEGNAPRLLVRAPDLPPDFVSFTDMLPALRAAEEYTFVLGMAGSEVLSISLKEDSPHLALSAGSGGGKSEMIKLAVAQVLHWGWNVIILDWKEESQEWADGLPGVRYVRSIEALHDTCVSIGDQVEHRKSERAPEQRAARSKVLIVSEEWGVTAPLLADYWSNLRSTAEPEERRTMPLKSPALQALMKLNFTGRSLGLHQFLVAQRFSARVTNGNADLRESFSAIFMTRWKAQTFKMLAPDVRPIPRKLTKPGQWIVIVGDECARFQGGLWTDEEAKEWATNGVRPAASPWAIRSSSPRANVGTLQHSTQEDQLPVRVTPGITDSLDADYLEGEVIEPVRLRKLRDLVDAVDHLGFSLKDLQRAASGGAERDLTFPAPEGGTQFKGYLYDEVKVLGWARKKRAAQAAERGVRQ